MYRLGTCIFACFGLALAGVPAHQEVEPAVIVEDAFVLNEDELKFEPGAMLEEELEILVEDYFKQNWGHDMRTNLKDFRWDNCGGIAGGLVSASVNPDPIVVPGTITVAVHAMANMTLASPLKTKLTIEIQVLGRWVKVPCIDQFGSCTYNDLCQLLEGVTCPDPLVEHNIPCKCPYSARSYLLPPSQFEIPEGPPSGNYKARAEVYDTSGRLLVCLEIQLTFE